MKTTGLILAAISTIGITFNVSARPLEYYSIPFSRDISNAPPSTRSDYLLKFPENPLTVYNIEAFRHNFPQRDRDGQIIVAINHRLLGEHEEGFNVYIEDLENEGYDVTLLDVDGGSAEELKRLLIDNSRDDAAGVILAGQMPLAWFEQLEHFDSEEEPDNDRLAEYPIDLFFSDWNGEWIDTSGNGIYDLHLGEWAPEVWLGRIAAFNLSRLDEDSLVAAYLDRVHAYRRGELRLPHRAIGYIDDDWEIASDEWEEELHLSFGMVDKFSEPDLTSGVDYATQIVDGCELVQVAVHSTTDSHSFLVEQRSRYDYFRFRTLRDEVVPQAFFYNLFACSAMNLDRNLCLGALYSLKPPYGLGAVGTTKVGGMLFYEDYYSQLGNGSTFGEAFKHWFTLHAREQGYENWSRSWFYGMTHYGDPTLALPRGLRVVEYEIVDQDDDGDGIADAGETPRVTFFIANQSDRLFRDVRCAVTSNDEAVTVENGGEVIGEINANETVEYEGTLLAIDPTTPDGYIVKLQIEMSSEGDFPWGERVSLPVRNAVLQPISFQAFLNDEDDDGFVSPGESGNLVVSFANVGGDDLRGRSTVIIEPLDDYFRLVMDTCVINPVPVGQRQFTEPMQYSLLPDADPLEYSLLRLRVLQNEIEYGRNVIAIAPSSEAVFDDRLDMPPQWVKSYPVTPGLANVWRWDAAVGDSSGGLAFGGPDTLLYPARSDGAIELPLMNLDRNAELLIRHRIDVEPEYDACVVEMNRSGNWERLEPAGGYNGRSSEIGSYPGGPCWNGAFDWRYDRVRLHGDGGPVRIRLRFVSDSGVEGSGWRIDRLALSGTNLEIPPEELPLNDFALLDAFPNPFNSTIRVRFSASRDGRLSVFNSLGEQVYQENIRGEGVSDVTTIDFSSLPQGIYFIILKSEKLTISRKIALVK